VQDNRPRRTTRSFQGDRAGWLADSLRAFESNHKDPKAQANRRVAAMALVSPQTFAFRSTTKVQTQGADQMFMTRTSRLNGFCREDRVPGTRKPNDRPRTADRRRACFQVEPLEDRQLMSWGAVPPAHIAPPVNNPPATYVFPEGLSGAGDAAAFNSIAQNEIDFYSLTAPQTGTCLFGIMASNVNNMVIGVYDASGNRLGYDHDPHGGDTATQMTVNLQSGKQYFFGVTNYLNSHAGNYDWSIDGPAHTAIELKAQALGWGFTGNQSSGLESYLGGFRIQFDNCDIYYSAATGAHEVHGLIRREYNATANETGAYGHSVQGILGLPTSDEMNVPGVSGARMNTFQGGAIYWSPTTGAHVVYGAIGAKYNSLGGAASYGLPTTDEAGVPDLPGVRVNDFQNGRYIYWSAATGAHTVYGLIGQEYNHTAIATDAYGNIVQKLLGAPTSDEMNVAGVPGARMNTFHGGAIYWSPSTGAHVVYGAIGAKYSSLGGPAAYGLPISDEQGVPDGQLISTERVTDFQNGRAIYWSEATGAHAVYGLIGIEYAATFNETGFYGTVVHYILGSPTSDEMNVPGVPGARMNTFQGGAIYWSPGTGAHVVYGAIGGLYNSMGGPTSYLGLPTSDEGDAQAYPNGRVQYFQNGKILWTPGGGAWAVEYSDHIDMYTSWIAYGDMSGSATLEIDVNGNFNFWGTFFNENDFGVTNNFMIVLVDDSGQVFRTPDHSVDVGSRHTDNWYVSGTFIQLKDDYAKLLGCRWQWYGQTNGVNWDSFVNTGLGLFGAWTGLAGLALGAAAL
jgi:uncharacterized protein with LGFP repeats